MDDSTQIRLRIMEDDLRSTRMRLDHAERRIQMLTDMFVVSGLIRSRSGLSTWACNPEENLLQFEMSSD